MFSFPLIHFHCLPFLLTTPRFILIFSHSLFFPFPLLSFINPRYLSYSSFFNFFLFPSSYSLSPFLLIPPSFLLVFSLLFFFNFPLFSFIYYRLLSYSSCFNFFSYFIFFLLYFHFSALWPPIVATVKHMTSYPLFFPLSYLPPSLSLSLSPSLIPRSKSGGAWSQVEEGPVFSPPLRTGGSPIWKSNKATSKWIPNVRSQAGTLHLIPALLLSRPLRSLGIRRPGHLSQRGI